MKTRQASRGHRRAIFPPLLLGIVALAVIAGVVTWKRESSTATRGLEQTRPITVNGSPLPLLPDDASRGNDPARGRMMPIIRGVSFDGAPVAIANDGHAKVIVFLAHWCPHCQAEVLGLVAFLRAGGLPAGVEMYSVSTAVRADRPNYPPSTWLEREQWPVPVIVDDPSGAAAEAAGLSGFPFFVFVRADGTVADRHEGELGLDELRGRLARLARPLARGGTK